MRMLVNTLGLYVSKTLSTNSSVMLCSHTQTCLKAYQKRSNRKGHRESKDARKQKEVCLKQYFRLLMQSTLLFLVKSPCLHFINRNPSGVLTGTMILDSVLPQDLSKSEEQPRVQSISLDRETSTLLLAAQIYKGKIYSLSIL